MVLGAASTALAVEPAGSPYAAVVARNVFGLKAPPPPPKPEDNKPPPPKITLQGITTMLGTKLVLMKVVVPPAKPGSKSEEVPLTLSVGQKAEDVEVLEIHETEPAWVKVNDYGTITNLNFKDNGVNLASATAPGVAPVAGPPRPGAVPPAGAALTAGGGYTPNPAAYQGRSNPHNSRKSSAGAAASNQGAAAPNTYAAVSAAPASTIQPAKNLPQDTTMTPEQAAIMEALYTTQHQKEIEAGTMPSVPGENPLVNNESTLTPQKTQ
jgi:hypothetical protein